MGFDLKKTMIGFCLLIGIIPFLVIGVYSYHIASQELTEKAFDQLKAVRDIKKHGIRDRIDTWYADMDMLALDKDVLEAFEVFSGYLSSGGLKGDAVDIDTPGYEALHDAYLGNFSPYVETLGYYDAFIIDPQGRVLFTVTKESDLGQNLATGPLQDSPLAAAWKKALTSENVFVDFEPYAPSNGIPAAFLAEPIRRNGKVVCVVALQISLTSLNGFMQQRAGMGETGETYLVGPDLLMRSDSFLDPEFHSVAASFANPQKGKVDTQAARQALNGTTDHGVLTDYNGVSVLSAYTPVRIGDTSWALIAEIDQNEALQAVSQLRTSMILVGVVIFVAIIFITLLFIKRELLRPFNALRSFANNVAQGDLDATPEGSFKPELADLRDAILSMVANLKAKMAEAEEKSVEAEEQAEKARTALTEAEAQQQRVSNLLEKMQRIADNANVIAKRVSSSSGQLTSQVEQVSQGAEIQRERVGETATAMEQMNATVMEVASNASNASTSAEKTKEKAALGASVVNEVVQAINRVNDLAERLKENTESLGTEAESINQVMNVISDIADQTNLLALNAAIEAARAGEAGRGFAVVADEVRKLAEKTMAATKEVGDKISRVQSATQLNMDSVEQAVEAVTGATEKANESGIALNEIVDLVEESAKQVTGIATAAEEQSAASEQISQSVEEINRIVSETTDGMVQSAKAVQELSAMAVELRELIRQLNAEDQSF